MAGRSGRKKKLSPSEQYELERSQEETRLLDSYQEGKTNVDWARSDVGYLEVILNDRIAPSLPLIPKADWLKREMAEWEERRPKVPSGRVQDPEAKIVKYRQRFVDVIRKLEPKALEELRHLGPIFHRLFKNGRDDTYLKVFGDLRINLIPQRLHVDESRCNFDHSYAWGEVYNTFLFSQERFMSIQPNYERRPSESAYTFIEDNSYELDSFDRVVKQAFSESADSPESILMNFFSLQSSIYSWAEKYNLRKDWLIDYAHYLISQYSQDQNLNVEDLVIGHKVYSPRTLASPFTFETSGWWASEEGETADQYVKRVTQEFEQYLGNYVISATRTLKLNNLKTATKPPTFESVEWLVCSTVKKWNADRIVEHFFPQLAEARTTKNGSRSFGNKKKYMEDEMRKLATYGLPLRLMAEST